jgi:hypothetical protein
VAAATQDALHAELDIELSWSEQQLPERERTKHVHRLHPYPGLIEYHEQHWYAYELLDLDDLRQRELGVGAAGTSREALGRYVDGVAAVLERSAASLADGVPLLVVVNDRRELYPDLLERAGLRLDGRYRRHVNRRAGRRAGGYFEDVLVARRA